MIPVSIFKHNTRVTSTLSVVDISNVGAEVKHWCAALWAILNVARHFESGVPFCCVGIHSQLFNTLTDIFFRIVYFRAYRCKVTLSSVTRLIMFP